MLVCTGELGSSSMQPNLPFQQDKDTLCTHIFSILHVLFYTTYMEKAKASILRTASLLPAVTGLPVEGTGPCINFTPGNSWGEEGSETEEE